MPRYEVHVREGGVTVYAIDAANAEEADQLACEGEGMEVRFYGGDWDTVCVEEVDDVVA